MEITPMKRNYYTIVIMFYINIFIQNMDTISGPNKCNEAQ